MTSNPQSPADYHTRIREELITFQAKTVAIAPKDSYLELVDEAVQAIEALYLELIGPDEPETGYGKRDGEYEMHLHRNHFRAELRAKLPQRPGGSE